MDKIVTNLTNNDINILCVLQEQIINLERENKQLWSDRKLLIGEINQLKDIVGIYEEGMKGLLEENEILKEIKRWGE